MRLPNKPGVTTQTKSTDVAGALRLLLKIRYNDNFEQFRLDLNKAFRKAEKKAGKQTGTYQVSKTTLNRWLTVGTDREKTKIITDRKTKQKTLKRFEFSKLPSEKQKALVQHLNKTLRKAPLEYKSSCKFAFTLTKDKNYITFVTGFATFVSKTQVPKPSVMKELIRQMVRKLTDHGLITPTQAIPKVAGIPFEGSMSRRGIPTADEAKFIMDLVSRPKTKPVRKLYGNTYTLHGSYSIWYCYKLSASDYPCFDYQKVDIGNWIDGDKKEAKQIRRRQGLFAEW